MKMKRLLSVLLVLTLVLGMVPGSTWATDIVDSGTCGEYPDWESVTWKLDALGTVTISGTGNIRDCDGDAVAPWEEYYKEIRTVVIEEGVTGIGCQAFYNCYNMETVMIPESVTCIWNSAFACCSSLASVTIPHSVTQIGSGAFSQCASLIDVQIPDSITGLPAGMFSGCKGLKGITLPESITHIGESAFFECSSLSGITIPRGVTGIGKYAFYGCESLIRIDFQGDAPSIGKGAFELVTATAYYPPMNDTWTADVMQGYGGTVTWMPYMPNPFTDVPVDKYFYGPVLWAYYRGITTGTTATTFAPTKDCTRGQIVTFLWRAAGEPEPTATNNPFTDVEEDDFYYKAVLWAVEKGITNGATATTFNPKGSCTRAQVVTFMWRAAGEPTPTSANNPFVDVPEGKYYHDAVLWAVEREITNGTSPTKFSPNNICNRGQIVTFLYRGYAQ